MMVNQGSTTSAATAGTPTPGKPYTIPTQWTRMITSEGETIASPRPEAVTPQIIYGADGTQYYAVPKASFAPSMATQGGSVIVSPNQVAAPQQLHSTLAASTTTSTANYPAFVTVPISGASTAIFHPVAIPVQGVHTPAFVLRPPYSGSTVYQPLVHPQSTTTTTGVYQNISDHRAIEATAQAIGAKTESTNTIVKTPDGETIVIIQRPVEGGIPVQLKEGATATANNIAIAGQSQIYQHHVVQPAHHQQQEIKQILIEQQPSSNTHSGN